MVNSLQILRALAALLVVVWHSKLSIKGFAHNYWVDGESVFRSQNYPHIVNHLYLGVDIFFCISGFIMCLLLQRSSGGPRSSAQFLLDRAVRIIPPYWFFTAFVYIAYSVSSGAYNLGNFSGNAYADASRFLVSSLLLPSDQVPVLPVGWTLIHETLFYIACGLMICFRIHTRMITVIATMTVIATALYISRVYVWHGYVLSMFYLEFLAGVLAYTLVNLSQRYAATKIATAIALYFVASYVLDAYPSLVAELPVRQIFGSVIGFLLIHGLIGIDREFHITETCIGRAMVRIGNASYTLYLFHWFVLSILGKIAKHFFGAPVYIVVTWQIFCIAIAIVSSVFVAERFELPFHRWLVSRCRNKRNRTTPIMERA